MASLSREFKVNYSDAISDEKAVFKGNFYRITVLTESLIRLEYDESGTLLASATAIYVKLPLERIASISHEDINVNLPCDREEI